MATDPAGAQTNRLRVALVLGVILAAAGIVVGFLVPYVRRSQSLRLLNGPARLLSTRRGTFPVYSGRQQVSLQMRGNFADALLARLGFTGGRLIGPWQSVAGINVAGPDITNELFAHIKVFNEVETVRITKTRITAEALDSLREFRNLRHLSINECPIREGRLEALRIHDLETLCLMRTRADDRTLESIRHMARLRHLNLTRTKVTDAGLKHLAGMPSLRMVILDRSLVTEQGAQWLRERLPGCEVRWEPLKLKQTFHKEK